MALRPHLNLPLKDESRSLFLRSSIGWGLVYLRPELVDKKLSKELAWMFFLPPISSPFDVAHFKGKFQRQRQYSIDFLPSVRVSLHSDPIKPQNLNSNMQHLNKRSRDLRRIFCFFYRKNFSFISLSLWWLMAHKEFISKWWLRQEGSQNSVLEGDERIDSSFFVGLMVWNYILVFVALLFSFNEFLPYIFKFICCLIHIGCRKYKFNFLVQSSWNFRYSMNKIMVWSLDSNNFTKIAKLQWPSLNLFVFLNLFLFLFLSFSPQTHYLSSLSK